MKPWIKERHLSLKLADNVLFSSIRHISYIFISFKKEMEAFCRIYMIPGSKGHDFLLARNFARLVGKNVTLGHANY
jgi:hypothetical protein